MKVLKAIREKRRKQTAEVFTPIPLVDEILDKLPEESWEEDKTFCDPAAGNGNFLVEVYRYKVEKYGHNPAKALETIYGVELQADNVEEMKFRLLQMAKDYGVDKKETRRILEKNIVCADALTFDWEFV
jgi:type I restriction-modification system DNA methylase subunit